MSRKVNLKQIKNKFYIITNGRETEKNYFELIKAKKSIYEVLVEFQNEDSLGLVNYDIEKKKDANQVWIVFDIDNEKDNKLSQAISKADKNDINYAFSNICFEVWLVSHFMKIESEKTEKELEKILSKYLSGQKNGLEYEKNNKETLKKYFIPNYKNAVENSKIVYQKYNNEHLKKYGDKVARKIWEWYSCTKVFKLIEALKLER